MSRVSSPLVETLGCRPDETVAIVNCDDFGSSHAANVATFLRATPKGLG